MSTGAGRRSGDDPHRPPKASDGSSAVSYLIAGMALYGGIGWLVGRWTHISALFPVGMIAGIGFGTALVILRFRPH